MAGVVFLLAAATRLIFLAWRGPAMTPDSQEYVKLAQNLLAHGTLSLDVAAPFNPTIRFPPLYPALIAALSWIGAPSLVMVATVQSVLDAVAAVMLLLMARTLVPLKWALFIALAYAFHPGAIASTRTILTETLFTALLISAIWILALALKRDRVPITAFSALFLGLAVLCRPIGLLLPFVLSVPVLLVLKRRRAVLHAVVLIGATLLVVMPWSIRSSRIAGKLVMVQDSSVAGALFYVATRSDWDQKDQSTLWPRFSEEATRMVSAAETRHQSDPQEEIRPDRLLLVEGLRNIRANPDKYLISRVRSFPYLFITSYDSVTGINKSFGTLAAQRDLLPLAAKLILLFTFSLLPFLLGLVGLIPSRRNITAALCATVWLFVLVFYIPLWVEPRYWTPCIPFLLISSALGAHTLWNRYSHRKSSDRR
jgi:4-amino-4-deoxy-L-arabinose transferase-like glycosyltransferase